MKMEILLEPTSNKLMVGDLCDSIRIKLVTTGKKRWYDSIRIKLVPERFDTSAGNHVKEILLKLNLPDHRILKDGGEGEIKKLEIEIWNLKVNGTDVASYMQRFQELALMCGRMFLEESDQVEKYVGGLPDMIQGSVMASKPNTMQEEIEIANDLMDQKTSLKPNLSDRHTPIMLLISDDLDCPNDSRCDELKSAKLLYANLSSERTSRCTH
ncbi:hypothetical protein Tco_0697814 [Tanacetum coccineum]